MLILLLAILLLLQSCAAPAVAQKDNQTAANNSDSLVFAKLDEYLSALDHLAPSSAAAEMELIVSQVRDSSLRARVAAYSYKHFRNSKVMGSENVAVYIYDRWFANYNLLFEDLDDFTEAELYAYLNRSSLIGCKAPVLELPDEQGDTISFPSAGRLAVIYFYSADCPKCLLLSKQICRLLQTKDYDLDFYAVYVGQDDGQWQGYMAKNLKINTLKSKIYNLKAVGGDFISAYAVVQTPRLLVVDKNSIIFGRGLDADALSELLSSRCE